jgi:hypothetical protein
MLDSGREVQLQTVVFDAAPCPPPPTLQPAHAELSDAKPMFGPTVTRGVTLTCSKRRRSSMSKGIG